MSAVTAYYLNEISDRLKGVSDALEGQRYGLGEWKSSTGTIPAEDLEGRTMLVLAAVGSNSGGGQMAMSFIPITALSFSVGSVAANNAAARCGTIMNFMATYTAAATTAYPILTIDSDGIGTIKFEKNGSSSINSTFYYTTL